MKEKVVRLYENVQLLEGKRQSVQCSSCTSMAAEDLLVDDSSDGEAVEAVGKDLPELDVEAPLALVVEAIYSCAHPRET